MPGGENSVPQLQVRTEEGAGSSWDSRCDADQGEGRGDMRSHTGRVTEDEGEAGPGGETLKAGPGAHPGLRDLGVQGRTGLGAFAIPCLGSLCTGPCEE